MSESHSDETALEVVDLDTCSKKKSIALGAAVAVLLGVVPYSYYLFLSHYFIGGLAAAGHFAKRHQVTITLFQGVKLGSVAAMIGMLVFFVALPLWVLPSVTEEQWNQVADQFIEQAYQQGKPEAAELAEKFLKPENVPYMLVGAFVVLFFGSLVLGSLGGLVGAAIFKKGPPAR